MLLLAVIIGWISNTGAFLYDTRTTLGGGVRILLLRDRMDIILDREKTYFELHSVKYFYQGIVSGSSHIYTTRP